jgi:hypothetical protein
MIDATYFGEPLREQVKRMGTSATVKLHLHDGSSWRLYTVERADVNYVLVQAYPERGQASLARGEGHLSLANGPRLAIPYHSIDFIEITTESQKDERCGFHFAPRP